MNTSIIGVKEKRTQTLSNVKSEKEKNTFKSNAVDLQL